MKSLKSLFVVMLMTVAFASTAFAIGAVADGEWVADGPNWKYVINGQAVVNDWALIKEGDDYNYYYFDAAGHTVAGIVKIDNEYYSFEKTGVVSKKGNEIKYGEYSFKISKKGLIEDFTDADYEEYLKEQGEKAAEKAANEAFQASLKAENERIKASEEAYKKEHAAEIAAAEAAKQAEKAAQAQAEAAKKAEAAAKSELLISSANRTKLQSEVNKANARNVAVRNLVNELRRQLNERRTQMINEAKTEHLTNPKAEIDKLADLYVEVVNEYAEVADDILDVLYDKYKMREETYNEAAGEIAEVLGTARSKFAEEFAKIGEEKK